MSLKTRLLQQQIPVGRVQPLVVCVKGVSIPGPLSTSSPRSYIKRNAFCPCEVSLGRIKLLSRKYQAAYTEKIDFVIASGNNFNYRTGELLY